MLGIKTSQIHRYEVSKGFKRTEDLLTVEEPMEIRLQSGPAENRREQSISVTMRTPGHDLELAAGFLFTENIISSYGDLLSLRHCETSESEGNIVKAVLREDAFFDGSKLLRHFYTSSSCGLCGKASIEALGNTACRIIQPDGRQITPETLLAMPDLLLEQQSKFRYTGGLHASALFGFSGNILLVREDVGRHNALDKIIGACLIGLKTAPADCVLFLSGRISFELVQKAAVAGFPIVAAVGAPSSLAVDCAREFGITLIGFLRNGRFNVYSGAERVDGLGF